MSPALGKYIALVHVSMGCIEEAVGVSGGGEVQDYGTVHLQTEDLVVPVPVVLVYVNPLTVPAAHAPANADSAVVGAGNDADGDGAVDDAGMIAVAVVFLGVKRLNHRTLE